MSPEERELYAMHMFNLGDEVFIGETDVIGEITGVQFAEGAEDRYRVHYADNNGNPHEEWWRASLLESVDDADNNVICFSCAKAAREARNATKH
jgi:hypothetical protein